MSADELKDGLHAHANRSTPPDVIVPNTIGALITWAIGKFGVGAVIVILLAIGVRQLYYDGKEKDALNRATSDKVVLAFENQTKASIEQTHAMREVSKSVEETRTELRELGNEFRRNSRQ